MPGRDPAHTTSHCLWPAPAGPTFLDWCRGRGWSPRLFRNYYFDMLTHASGQVQDCSCRPLSGYGKTLCQGAISQPFHPQIKYTVKCPNAAARQETAVSSSTRWRASTISLGRNDQGLPTTSTGWRAKEGKNLTEKTRIERGPVATARETVHGEHYENVTQAYCF